MGACVYGAGALVEAGTGVRAIEVDSACPVAGCASGECHGYENVPAPATVATAARLLAMRAAPVMHCAPLTARRQAVTDLKKCIIVDAAVLLIYALVANPAMTGIPVHEWLGIGVFW